MSLLQDHIILVTGAGSGLGLGIAKYCQDQGATVIISDVSSEKIKQLKTEFPSDHLILQCDVTQISDLEQCRDAIVEKYGRLDALIGAQGIFDGNVPLKQMTSTRLDLSLIHI